MSRTALKRCLSRLVVILVVALGTLQGARADEWKWEVIPFLWAPDVGVDVSLNETDISPTVDFGEILERTDIGALVNFAGRKGRGGFFVDVVYLSVSDDRTNPGGGLIPAGTRSDAEYDQLVGEVGGVYRLTGDEQGLDLIFGARLLEVSLDLGIDFPDTSILPDRTRSGDASLLDGFAGLRYRGDISERWHWSIRGDVGAGDTDLTWLGALTFGAKLGKSGNKTLYLGYRHLAYEFDRGSKPIKEFEVELSGPGVGFGFSF